MNLNSKKTRYCVLSIMAIVLVLIVVGAAWSLPFLMKKAEIKEDTMIYIYPNMTEKMLTDSLSVHFDEEFSSRVVQLLGFKKVDVSKHTGAYKVTADDTPLEVANRIRSQQQTPVKFTFNNLRTKEQFAERAAKQLMMREGDVLALLNDEAFCESLGKSSATIVSVLQPDSYEFYWNVKPKEMIVALKKYYDKFWNDTRKTKAKSLNLTPDEVVTLASIVEEETSKSDERGAVARLYLNRLNKGMLLQADPTVKYAIGDFALRRITFDMLTIDSPYNTYRYQGLPPGPIRMPEKATLNAVLNAQKHNYLYMCAKEDFSGYHNFAVTHSEHLRNAANYHRELNKRGIK